MFTAVLYGADFIYTETQYLAQGSHTIHADAAQYENKGFELVNAAANSQEVNVTEKRWTIGSRC